MEKVFRAGSVTREMLRRFSCSETMLTLLNAAAGIELKELEEASDPLCAGLLAEMDGACGALWGAALAAGVRARARIPDSDTARRATLEAARKVVAAHIRAGRPMNCADITGMSRWSLAGFIRRGNLGGCAALLADMAPVFHDVIDAELREGDRKATSVAEGAPLHCRNCAVEAFDRVCGAIGLPADGMGTVAAGFAGGLGLSGNVCGALASSILAVTLKYFMERNKPKHSLVRSELQGLWIGTGWMIPAQEVSREFRGRFGSRLCSKVSGERFAGPEALSAFLATGGCGEVLNAVTASAARATLRESPQA